MVIWYRIDAKSCVVTAGQLVGAVETTRGKQAITFQPGQSGNPAGRPIGARHKTTLAIESLLDGEAEALTRKVVEKAKEGDMVALKLCLDRLAPVRKGRPVQLDLPDIHNASDLAATGSAVGKALADGKLSPEESTRLVRVLCHCHAQTHFPAKSQSIGRARQCDDHSQTCCRLCRLPANQRQKPDI